MIQLVGLCERLARGSLSQRLFNPIHGNTNKTQGNRSSSIKDLQKPLHRKNKTKRNQNKTKETIIPNPPKKILRFGDEKCRGGWLLGPWRCGAIPPQASQNLNILCFGFGIKGFLGFSFGFFCLFWLCVMVLEGLWWKSFYFLRFYWYLSWLGYVVRLMFPCGSVRISTAACDNFGDQCICHRSNLVVQAR